MLAVCFHGVSEDVATIDLTDANFYHLDIEAHAERMVITDHTQHLLEPANNELAGLWFMPICEQLQIIVVGIYRLLTMSITQKGERNTFPSPCGIAT